MNETILIIMVGGIVGGLLGRLILWLIALYRKIRPAKDEPNNQIQVGSILKEPSAPRQPASPRRSVATFAFLTVLAAVWALGIGFMAGVFSHLIYIIFLWPFIMGINGGKMIMEVMQRAKMRTASQLLFLSILSAIVIYGTFHYTRYMGFQVTASVEIFSGLSEATEEQNLQVTRAFLDYALKEETGHSGFPGYILYQANRGVSIGRLSRSNSFNLGPVLTWLYWLLEFGVILGVTFQKGRKWIHMPFCESCGDWYGGEKHLGGTAAANESLVLDLIRHKDFEGLGRIIEKNADIPSLELYYQGCQRCGQSQSQLVVRHAFQTAKGSLQFSDAAQTVLQAGESSRLLSQLSPAGD